MLFIHSTERGAGRGSREHGTRASALTGERCRGGAGCAHGPPGRGEAEGGGEGGSKADAVAQDGEEAVAGGGRRREPGARAAGSPSPAAAARAPPAEPEHEREPRALETRRKK